MYRVPIDVLEEITDILDKACQKYEKRKDKPSVIKRAKKMSNLLKRNYDILNDRTVSKTKS